jgi:hypothetical protein
MNTTEGNKLIAEFMGHKIDWGFNKDSILYMPQGKGNATNNSVVISCICHKEREMPPTIA